MAKRFAGVSSSYRADDLAMPRDNKVLPYAQRYRILTILLAAASACMILLLLLFYLPYSMQGPIPDDILRVMFTTALLLVSCLVAYCVMRWISLDVAVVALLVAVIAVEAIADIPHEVVAGRGLVTFVLPILVASLLLYAWSGFVIAALSSLIVVAVASGRPEAVLVLPIIFVFFFIAFIAWVFASHIESGRHQLQQALADVKRHESDLEARVLERTAELEQADRELSQSARLKDEFMATMSHELRTPLTGILTGADALLEGVYGGLSERQLRAVRLIYVSGKHLLILINDILDLSRIEAGELLLERQRFRVDEVCQSSLALVTEQAQAMKHTLGFVCEPPDLMLSADEMRVRQMLTNLLGNAVKFTPQGGTIELSARLDPDAGIVVLSVKDNGIGIAPENMARVFRPFVQLDSGLSRAYDGTGLGLALVRRLAELHGGGVGVESVLGEGSRFWIELPWVDGGAATEAGTPTSPTRS